MKAIRFTTTTPTPTFRRRQFPLSQPDWTEIWNCSEANVQNRLPVDGLGTTDAMQRRLTARDWIQIYLAVEAKRDALRDGFYGRDRTVRQWLKHMNTILSTLAPVSAHFIAPTPRTRTKAR